MNAWGNPVAFTDTTRQLMPVQAYPARVHPIRCAASLANPLYSSGGHKTHRCIHPATESTDVVGLLVHLCQCGTEWTTEAGSDD